MVLVNVILSLTWSGIFGSLTWLKETNSIVQPFKIVQMVYQIFVIILIIIQKVKVILYFKKWRLICDACIFQVKWLLTRNVMYKLIKMLFKPKIDSERWLRFSLKLPLVILKHRIVNALKLFSCLSAVLFILSIIFIKIIKFKHLAMF